MIYLRCLKCIVQEVFQIHISWGPSSDGLAAKPYNVCIFLLILEVGFMMIFTCENYGFYRVHFFYPQKPHVPSGNLL